MEAYERWELRLLDANVLRLVSRDETDSAQWLESCRWPDGVRCLRCESATPYIIGSVEGPRVRKEERRREWKCRDCGYIFTVRRGSFMDGSKSPLAAWCTALLVALEFEPDQGVTELTERAGIQRRTAQRLLPVAQQLVDEFRAAGEVLMPAAAPTTLEENTDPPEPTAPQPVPTFEDPVLEHEETPESAPIPQLVPAAGSRNPRRTWWEKAILLFVVATVAAWAGSTMQRPTILRDQWVSANGDSHVLETDRLPHETRESWEARHRERSSKLRALFPVE